MMVQFGHVFFSKKLLSIDVTTMPLPLLKATIGRAFGGTFGVGFGIFT